MVRVLLLATLLLFLATNTSAFNKRIDIPWMFNKYYHKGDLVWYRQNDSFYVAQKNNKGQRPGIETAGAWKKVESWSIFKRYRPGNLVEYRGEVYRAPKDHFSGSTKAPNEKTWKRVA